MHWLLHLSVIVLVTYLVADALSLPFWVVAIAVVAIYYFFVFRKAPAATGSASYSFAGIWDGLKNFMVAVLVFTAIMMLVTRFINVSNNYAFSQFQKLGWRPWLWPHGVALDLLLWVCAAMLVAGVAARATRGNWKIAGAIFTVSFVLIFTMRALPRTGEATRPKPATATTPAPGETQGWADTDAAIAEGRGIAPVVAETAKKAVLGNDVSRRTGTLLRETVGGFWQGLFPPTPKPPVPPRPVASYAPAPVVVPPAQRPFTTKPLEIPAEGMTVYLYWGWKASALDGAITITAQRGGQIIHDRPSVMRDIGFQPDGWYTFASNPPGEKRQVQVENRW